MPFAPDRDKIRLQRLAEQGAYLGTSSWIYPGWRGQVYRGDYSGKRNAFVQTRFRQECLGEFSRIFATTCFDGAYWRFPTFDQLSEFYSQVPEYFRLALKVTDLITMRQFRTPMMGARAGDGNRTYLDARTFLQEFLAPAQSALKSKLGPIIFEFSPFFFDRPGYAHGYTPLQFVKDLHRFFEQLPRGPYYAVEVRDPILVAPEFGRYLDCLSYHGIAHVINEQTWMPPIQEQLELPGILSAGHVVVRGLVRPGVSHEAAVKEFEPYSETKLVLERERNAMAELLHISLADQRTIFAYLNNRLEGNAPNTISAVIDLFDDRTSVH